MAQSSLKTRVVGINVSYGITSFAIVDVRGNIIARDQFNTTDYPNINEFVAHLSDSIVTFVEANGGYESIRSVGISVPSGNFVTGCIENSGNLQWKGIIPLAAMMRDRLGLSVALANNAHARAQGEYSFGSAHGMKDFILITLGQGFGSTFFSNGKAHLGAHGFAGEFGHTCVVKDGRPCMCGKRGCFEAYCSERGIVETARKTLAASDEPSLMRDVPELSVETITECCDKGDRLAIETFRKTGKILGIGMANYASVLNPEAIIFTGSVMKVGKWLLDPTEESFEEHVFRNIKGRVKIINSTMNSEDQQILGASVMAWDIKEYSLFK